MLNIALCDDMPILREVLEILICEYEVENNLKFNIYQFDSGEALLETFDKNRAFFDLFFLDYSMKRLTGVDTALHIRRYDKACSIVFVTSSTKRYELMAVNPLQILSKPVQKEDIFEVLNRLLSKQSKSG